MSSVLYEDQLNKPTRSRRSREPVSPVDETPVLFQLPDLSTAPPQSASRPMREVADAAASVSQRTPPASSERKDNAGVVAAKEGAGAEDKERSPHSSGSRDGRQRRRRRSRPQLEPTPATWQATTTRVVLGVSLAGLFVVAWSFITGGKNDEPSFSSTDPWVVQSAPQQDAMRVEPIDYLDNSRSSATDYGAWLGAETMQAGVEFVQPTNDKPLAPPLAGGEARLTADSQANLSTQYGFSGSTDHGAAVEGNPASGGAIRQPTPDRRGSQYQAVDEAHIPRSSERYLQVDLHGGYSAAGESVGGVQQGGYGASAWDRQGGANAPPSEAPYGQRANYRTAERGPHYEASSRFEPYQGESAGQPGDPRRDAPYQQIRPRNERIGSGIY